jgi:16S rRNA (guanine966-N2)-methyltransferase
MRVTGGVLGGRLLKTPRGDAVRPTQDLVRQALFSSLAARVPGCRFLDLFAGSGAVGLDAWSRGAAYVCWVENDARVFQVLAANVKTLCGQPAEEGAGQGRRAVRCDVFRFLSGIRGGTAYDLVFADPPYDRDGGAQWAARLLDALGEGGGLAEDGLFVMEQATGEAEAAHGGWEVVAVKTYGGTRLTVYRRRKQQS